MRDSPSADQVLSDIEFELLQGAILQDELGQGVQAVKQFQNKTRTEVFQPDRRTADWREVASRQFQLNDMLITLLQETAVKIQHVQLELRRATQAMHRIPQIDTSRADLATEGLDGLPTSVKAPALGSPEKELREWPPLQLETATRSEELHVEQDVRPVNVPFIGRMLTRLRSALHNLSLYYVGKLADKQATVNQTLADSILQMNRLLQHQQEQIQALNQKLDAFQMHLNDNQEL